MNHMDNRKAIIGILSLQHAGVDFLCALAVYGRYISPSVHPLNIYLIYNFCAFALQMPLGVIADRMTDKAGTNKLYPALFPHRGHICRTVLSSGAHCSKTLSFSQAAEKFRLWSKEK